MAVITMLVVLIAGGLSAQEPTDEPEFVQNMVQLMTEAGWTDPDIAEFRQACLAFQWQGTEDLDPQMLMRALQYSHEYEGPDGAPSPDEQAQLAHELALQSQEMLRLGLDSRDIAVVATAATRETLQLRERADSDSQSPDTAERLRTRLQDATQDRVQLIERIRDRINDPQGPATRTGEDHEPGTSPATPVSDPGSGSGEGPADPGDPGDPADPGGPNGPSGPGN